ncbi:MAG: S8 family serine peptidase [Candidatus Delongbacteria bacterium]|nr:S8 family serine peptidase [Candidatus Delongbacteria bacterium]
MVIMKLNRIITFLIFLIIYATNLYCQKGLNYVNNQVIVKFKDDILNYEFLESDKVSMNSIDVINQEYVTKGDSLNLFLNKTTTVSKVFTALKPSTKNVVTKSGKIIDNTNLYNTVVFTLDSEDNIINLCKELNNIIYIEYAEPNYILDLHYYPNDEYYNNQDSFRLIGLTNLWLDNDYYGNSNIRNGNPNIRIGILDTGIDYNNRDLGDGDLYTETAKVVSGINSYGVINSDCMDTHGHGTRVAGIVAAYTNNKFDVAGIAGDCSLVGLKANMLDEVDQIDYCSAANAIEIASSNFSCDIINMSFGTQSWNNIIWADEGFYALQDATMLAIRRGVFISAAKGNDGTSDWHVPSDFSSYIMSVGASDRYDCLASFEEGSSNYGNGMDILAPGTAGEIFTTALGSVPQPFEGTSAAAPHVAGVAALLLSLNYNLYSEDLHEIITRTAFKTSEMNGQNYTDREGYGRLDAKSAIEYVLYGNIEHHVEGISDGNGYWIEDSEDNPTECIINVPFNTVSYNNNSPGIHLHTWAKWRKKVNLPEGFSRVEIWGNNSGTGSVSISEPSYGDCYVISIDEDDNTAILESRNYKIWTLEPKLLGLTTAVGEMKFGYTTVGFYDNVLIQLSETEIITNASAKNIVIDVSNIGDHSDKPFDYQIESDCTWIHLSKNEGITNDNFTISIDKNNTDAQRNCSVIIKSKWAIENSEIIINQDRAPSGLYIENSEFNFTSLEQSDVIQVRKTDLANILDVDYSIDMSTLPSWVQITSQNSSIIVPPGETNFSVNEYYLDFAERTAVISLTSLLSSFVQNPVTFNDPPYNTINVNQAPCPDYVTDHLKPRLAVFDNTKKLLHYDPEDPDQHTIKTNVTTDFTSSYDFIATTSCDYDNDGIDEQVVLYSDGFFTSLYFYKLGESNYSKQISLGWDNDYSDIESLNVNNDGLKEIIVAGKNNFLVIDVSDGTQLYNYDLTSEALIDEVSIAIGDFNNDNIKDIVLCDGYKIITRSIDKGTVKKIIDDCETIVSNEDYSFRDITSFHENNDILILVFQGISPTHEIYENKVFNCYYDFFEKEFFFDTYAITIPALDSRDIRKIVADDFIKDDNNFDELAILHNNTYNESPSIENTTSISLFKLVRAKPNPPTDQLELMYEIDASEYIENYLDLTSGQFYDKLKLVLQPETELIIEPDDDIIFLPNMKVEARSNSKITVKNGAVLDLTNVSITGDDNWQGITAEIGSTVILSHTTITNAACALDATDANVSINYSSFIDCENGILFVNCNSEALIDNYLIGKGTGCGITLVQSQIDLFDNTIKEFQNGVKLISCSAPVLSKNIIKDNINYGLYIEGYNTFPELKNYLTSKAELNNEIFDNGIGTEYSKSAQIYLKYSAGISMGFGYNNIYSGVEGTVPEIPCIRGASYFAESKVAMPVKVVIDADYNYWGMKETGIDDNFTHFFDLWDMGTPNTSDGYLISYNNASPEPYKIDTIIPVIYSPGVEPDPGSIMLDNAIRLEIDGNLKPAIKLYEKIISKYDSTTASYVASARLPYVYEKAEEDLEPLLKVYDSSIESDEVTNKVFFKEMKVSTNIRSKKYDDAINISKEMLADAQTEEEKILCEIDIAISNMMKDAETKIKSANSSIINDLLAKLGEDNQDGEQTDITESVLPTKFILYQNYPNPFNPITEIKYALPNDANVCIKIYNSNGNIVDKLVNDKQNAGYHRILFEGSKLSNGVYYYSMQINGNILDTKRMLLIK